jgi:hypothetical protein
MQKATLEKLATLYSSGVLIAVCWYLTVQIMDTLEFLEMAYG